MADLALDVQSAPTTPAAGVAVVYVDTATKRLASKDDAGTVTAYGLTTPISVPNGGTGDATLTAHGVLVGNGAGAVVVTAVGATNTVLHGNTGADPTYSAVALAADVSGTLPVANGGTNKTSLALNVTLTDGATPALDASLVPAFLSGVFRLAAAGDRTIAVPSNATAGQKIVIEHFASGGARTLALNTGAGGFRFSVDIPSLSQTASGKTDYIGCLYNDTDNKWDVVAVTKGF
jgi:hypothetical protein